MLHKYNVDTGSMEWPRVPVAEVTPVQILWYKKKLHDSDGEVLSV